MWFFILGCITIQKMREEPYKFSAHAYYVYMVKIDS